MAEITIPTAKTVRSVARSAKTSERWGKWLWLRLLILTAMGIGLAMPLIVAATYRLGARDPARMAHQFLVGMRDGDTDSFVDLLTAEALGAERGIETIKEIGAAFLQGFDFSLEPPTHRDEFLNVPFRLHRNDDLPLRPLFPQEKDQKRIAMQTRMVRENTKLGDGKRGVLHLRKVAGNWRVSGIRLPPGFAGLARQLKSSELEIDFEKLGAPVVPTPQQIAAPSEPLGSISATDFAAAWQIDLDVKNRPASEVLQAKLGNAEPLIDFSGRRSPIYFQGAEVVKKALARPVSVHLSQVSRFQAIEAICRPLGLWVSYDTGNPVIHPGKRSHAIASNGPFLLEATSVNEDPNKSNATGKLSLRLYTIPVSPKIAALLSKLPLLISNIRVAGPTGEDLYYAHKGARDTRRRLFSPDDRADAFFLMLETGSWGTVTGSWGTNWSVPLKNLVRDLDVIGEVTCSIQVALPREVRSFRMEPVQLGSSAAVDDFRLSLKTIDDKTAQVPGNPQLSLAAIRTSNPRLKRFDFHAAPVKDRRLCWQSFDAGGRLESGWSIPSSAGDFSLFLSRDPVHIVFQLVTIGETLSWDYRLSNIPLQRLPRRIEPLRFAGHSAPVSIASPVVTDKGVELRISNHCQKVIDTVEIKLAYRDGKGRILREVVRRLSTDAEDGVDAKLSPLGGHLRTVDTGERPPGTRSATAIITEAFFKDATSWKR